MPKVHCQHRHTLSVDEARRRLRALMEKFAVKYNFATVWEDEQRAVVKGRGVTGSVRLLDSQVLFELDLSFLLTPFRSRIEAGIQSEVSRALSA